MGIRDYQRITSKYRDKARSPGWSIQLVGHPFIRFIASLVIQFLNIRGRQAKDIDDAFAFLIEKDDDLPSFDELKESYHNLRNKMQSNLL